MVKMTKNWTILFENEFDRLVQAFSTQIPHCTNILFSVPHTKVPASNILVYSRVYADTRPKKINKSNCFQLTVGNRNMIYLDN